MECDEVPQNVQSTLPNRLEDVKMDVDLPVSLGTTIEEELAAMDACETVIDDTMRAEINESFNGIDETDSFGNKSDEFTSGTEDNTIGSMYSSKADSTEPIVKTSSVKKVDKPEELTLTKEEIDTNYYQEFLIPESISDREYATAEEMLSNSPWELGQLAWARMSIYPFWPCVVTYEPSPIQTYRKVQSKGRSKTLMIHVHFFNDHGRHSWIPSHHMIPFNGIEDFRKRAKLITDTIRKKEPKFAAALIIKPNIFSTWQGAVAEAMDVLYELDISPLEKFKMQKRKQQSSARNEVETKRKRKSKGDDDGKEVKKACNNSSKSDLSSKENDVVRNLNLYTPPLSPENPTKYRKEYNKKQKRIKKMVDKLQPPDFEVFFERNYDDLVEQNPGVTDKEIRMSLMATWSNMQDKEKLRFRSTYLVPRDSHEKEKFL